MGLDIRPCIRPLKTPDPRNWLTKLRIGMSYLNDWMDVEVCVGVGACMGVGMGVLCVGGRGRAGGRESGHAGGCVGVGMNTD